MPRKRKSLSASPVREHVPANAHWIITEEIRVNGRVVTPGVEVKISGAPGRYAYKRHVLNPANDAEWIDVIGPVGPAASFRAFRPDRITTVHRLTKARPKK